MTFENWSAGGVVAGWVVLGFVLAALLLVLNVAHGSGAVSEEGLQGLTIVWAGLAAVGVAVLGLGTWRVFGRRGSVVVDTNVFVAAGFNPGSASADVVGAVRDGRLRMPWTDATRDEVRRILRRIPPLAWSGIRPLFRNEDRVAGPLEEDGLGWIPDPADRKFAALTRRTGAVLISSDEDLLGGRSGSELTIVTPGEYRARG